MPVWHRFLATNQFLLARYGANMPELLDESL